MLVWREGPRIDVDVGVDLDGCDVQAAGLEDGSHAAGYNAFPDARDHAARHQNILHTANHTLDKPKTGTLLYDST